MQHSSELIEEQYSYLFAVRVALQDTYESESYIIRELKNYLLDIGKDHNEINQILYGFYQYYGIDIQLNTIEQVSIINNEMLNCMLGFMINSYEPTPSEPTPSEPSSEPTGEPSSEPTGEPSSEPSSEPTSEPSSEPTSEPSSEPSGEPTGEPSSEPTGEPTSEPSSEPSSEPTGEPSSEPTGEPSSEPTGEPSSEPTGEPSSEPTGEPTTSEPTGEPTNIFQNPPTFITFQILSNGESHSFNSQSNNFNQTNSQIYSHNSMINILNSIFNELEGNLNENELTDNTFEDVIITVDENDIKKLKSIKLQSNIDNNCIICMENMIKDEIVTELNCGHFFHTECIEPYLKQYNYKCPICRSEVGKPKYNTVLD
jgi:hypothetical protein